MLHTHRTQLLLPPDLHPRAAKARRVSLGHLVRDPELSLNVDHYLYGSMSAMVTVRGRALTRRAVRHTVGARLRAGGEAPAGPGSAEGWPWRR